MQVFYWINTVLHSVRGIIAQPVMDRLGIDGTLRVSFALYNTKDEIDKLVEAIWKFGQCFCKSSQFLMNFIFFIT